MNTPNQTANETFSLPAHDDPRIKPLTDAMTMIRELCPMVLELLPDERVYTSMWREGMARRYWFDHQEMPQGEEITLRVSDVNSVTPSRLDLLDAVALMEVPDRFRVLADLWQIYLVFKRLEIKRRAARVAARLEAR